VRLKDEFKTDQGYKIDPKRLVVDPGWNVRIDTPALREENLELKESIRALGVLEPLTFYVRNDEDLVITNGHRRLAMVMELISEGVEIRTVPGRLEPPGNDSDRCLSMLSRNSGLRLPPLETAIVVKRLMGYGWDDAAIRAKTGFSDTYTAYLMSLLASPAPILSEVKAGNISAHLAVQVQKDSPAEAPQIIQEAGEIAKASGAKRTAPKHVKEAMQARAKANGTPEPIRWAKVGPQAISLLRAVSSYETGAIKRAQDFLASIPS
jgi:ParB-like chromosome segregation protein Spo0J